MGWAGYPVFVILSSYDTPQKSLKLPLKNVGGVCHNRTTNPIGEKMKLDEWKEMVKAEREAEAKANAQKTAQIAKAIKK